MEVRIKDNNGYVDADWTIEDGVMIVSPKVEKFEPKDGDVIYIKASGEHIIIYKEHKYGIGRYVNFSNNEYLYIDSKGIVCDKGETEVIRPATEEEKKLLFDKLKEEGLTWDAEKKEVVKLKWKPKNGETYFSPIFSNIDFLFSTCSNTYTGHFTDEMTIEKMRAFKTKDECQSFCDKLNQTIEEYEL